MNHFPSQHEDEYLRIITTDLGRWWYDQLREAEDFEKTVEEVLETLNIIGRTSSNEPNAVYFFSAVSECIANDHFQAIYNILTNSIDDFVDDCVVSRAKRMITNALRNHTISTIESSILVKYLEFLHIESEPMENRQRDLRERQAAV